MPKLTLSDVTNLGGNPISAQQVINTNSDRIEAAMEKTLSRDGSTPNQMESDFDMNHYDIINAATIHSDRLLIDGVPLEDLATKTQLDKEVTDRIAGDTALANSINIERAERISGDTNLASLIGQAGPIEVPIYDTRLAVEFANIKPTINVIRTGGYSDPGDGGAALYKKVGTEPTHAGKVQSADGAWWELSGPYYTVEMFGAKVGEDSTIALQAACDFISKKAVTVSLGVGTYIATDTLLIDFTSSIMGKGRLVGEGLSQSEIYTNITSGPLIHIRGDWGTSEQYRNAVKNIALRSEQNAGEGIYLEDISYPVISRVSARGFSRGLYGTDVILSLIHI